MKKIIIVHLIILTCFCLFSENKNVFSIAIFPFYPVQKDFPEKYSYLKDTIPDMIRQNIIDQNNFYIIENEKIFTASNELNLNQNFYEDEKSRFSTADKLKVDFFCYGYFIIEDGYLNVFFILVDSSSKRTKKIEKGKYLINEEIFKNIEITTKYFSDWINISLPELKENESLDIINKSVSIINNNDNTDDLRNADSQKNLINFDYKMTRYFEIKTSFIYYFFMYPFNQYVNNNFGAELSLKYFIPKATYLYVGISGIFYLIYGKSGTSNSSENILLYNIPVILKFGVNFHLVKYLELDTSLGAGISIFSGYFISDLRNYVRPAILFDLDIIYTPIKYFKVGAGFLLTSTFYAYNNWTLITISPRLSIGASF